MKSRFARGAVLSVVVAAFVLAAVLVFNQREKTRLANEQIKMEKMEIRVREINFKIDSFHSSSFKSVKPNNDGGYSAKKLMAVTDSLKLTFEYGNFVRERDSLLMVLKRAKRELK
jgi:hypothetical protein